MTKKKLTIKKQRKVRVPGTQYNVGEIVDSVMKHGFAFAENMPKPKSK